MGCVMMKELQTENLSQIRGEVANTIINKLSIGDEDIKINRDNGLSAAFSTLIFEIKLLITEFATNAIEHGIDPKYVINEENGQVMIAFTNLKKKHEAQKVNGEGGYGIMLAQRFPEIYHPEVIAFSKNGFYVVILTYDLTKVKDYLLRACI